MTQDKDSFTEKTRRTFIKTAGIATAGLFAFSGSAAAHDKHGKCDKGEKKDYEKDDKKKRDKHDDRKDGGDGRRDGGDAEASNDADIDNDIDQDQDIDQDNTQNGAAVAPDGDADVDQDNDQDADQDQTAVNYNDVEQDALGAALSFDW